MSSADSSDCFAIFAVVIELGLAFRVSGAFTRRFSIGPSDVDPSLLRCPNHS